MSKNFRRIIEIIIGRSKFTYPEFEITFNINFDSDSIPDEGEISVFNLSDESVNDIKRGQNIIVNAGYEDDIGSIIDGVITSVNLVKNGTDRELKIKALNVTSQFLETKIAYTYGKGAESEYLIRDVLGYAGITPNVVKLVTPLSYESFGAYGKVIDVVKQLAGDAGSDIVIKNSSISIVPENSEGDEIGYFLNSKTGLISIEPLDKSTTPAQYKVKMMLNHAVNVYTILDINSETFKGRCICTEGKHSSSDFVTEVEILPL